MSQPTRIQRSRRKGWRAPEGAVYVGRGSKWGNPYKGDANSVDREYMTALFEEMLERPDKSGFINEIKEHLRGKNLMCWCPLDQPCHADALLKIANKDS
jgi:hypothetical protein